MQKPLYSKTRLADLKIWAPVTPAWGSISVERRGTSLMLLTPALAARLGARLLKVAGVVEERRRREACDVEERRRREACEREAARSASAVRGRS